MASGIDKLAGKTLGTCTLEKQLGQGGMGTVYLAQQTRPFRHVAVKVLHPQLAPDSQVFEEFLIRFRREADVIARLEHIHIMPIYEYGEQDGQAYLVMPYLSGGSLRDVLAQRGALPLQEVITYITQAAAALDYAHARGVVHRDLKPANFLLHADGRLVLADFGIARIMEENAPTVGPALTQAGMMVGTPDYMAPEMARGEVLDYRADIYELGIVLFQLLSGHTPFSGNTPYVVAIKHIQEPLPLLHPTHPEIPDGTDAVIQKATAKQREERYPSVSAMAEALRNTFKAQDTQRAEPHNIIPTMLSPAPSTIAPTVPAQSNTTPPAQQQINPPGPVYPIISDTQHNQQPVHIQTPPSQAAGQRAVSIGRVYNSQPTHPTQVAANTPYPSPIRTTSRSQQPWWIVSGILLALILVIGGILIGLQFNRGTDGSSTTTNNGTPSTQVTPDATSLTTATTQPAATPSQIASTPPLQTTIPVGRLLYQATRPGSTCDSNGGTWANYNGVRIECLASQTRISSTTQLEALQGTFLTALPGQSYPADYIIQIQLQQYGSTASDFGLYFRNQPGTQQGAYTLMISPDNTWSANIYDNTTGAPTRLTGGYFGDAHGPMTLAIVVKGQLFSFYVNGKLLGSTSNGSYKQGTAGIAVDRGSSIVASNFAFYTIAD